MSKVYMYVMSRDFGFAPNPFHGVCTLATCKPKIRSVARVGDWILGLGGHRLKAFDRCIYAMRVDEAMTFDEYWHHPDHLCKRPVRIGTRKTMVGDNIYHRGGVKGEWVQADSHHSRQDGTPDPINVSTDTGANRVLLSRHFIYYGRDAVPIPCNILEAIGYSANRSHRTFDSNDCEPILEWLAEQMQVGIGRILADPFDFEHSGARYSPERNRIIA